MGEQFLVKGAGNFRQENWVIVVLKSCDLAENQVCMECPASWARCKHPKHILLVVHQDVRELGSCWRKIATAFSLRFVTIAPAAAQTSGACGCIPPRGAREGMTLLIASSKLICVSIRELTGRRYRKREVDRDRRRAVSARSNGAAADRCSHCINYPS